MRKIIVLMLGLLFAGQGLAYDDCPFGLINDTYPGECGRYLDTDSDGICDHSQSAPEVSGSVGGCDTADSTASDSTQIISSGHNQPTPVSLFEKYAFFQITILTLLFLLVGELAIKNRLLLKYIVNVALLVSFLAASITAIIYFFNISGLQGTIIDLHVKLGLVAVWIGIYHAIKHVAFYTKCRPIRAK